MNDSAIFRQNLLRCLGGEWPEPCPLDPHQEDSIARIGYRIEKVTYQVEPGEHVLCPDALCFEERQDSILRGGDFERFVFLRYLVNGKCLAWKYILDMRRAIDYLCSRPDVNADAIGCYGHSLGSIFTWLIGPWETRLRCLVGNCALPTYSAIHKTHRLAGLGIFIPGLNQYGDTPDIAALIAPRPLHLSFGTEDRHSPVVDVKMAMKTIEKAYY